MRKKKATATFDPVTEDIGLEPSAPMPDEGSGSGPNGSSAPGLGLEVKDLNSIEVISQDDSLEKRYVKEGDDRFELLIFPRSLLLAKFCPLGGMLSIPKIQNSEWFKKTLREYNFINPDRITKNNLGNILLPVQDSLDYQVKQRL